MVGGGWRVRMNGWLVGAGMRECMDGWMGEGGHVQVHVGVLLYSQTSEIICDCVRRTATAETRHFHGLKPNRSLRNTPRSRIG